MFLMVCSLCNFVTLIFVLPHLETPEMLQGSYAPSGNFYLHIIFSNKNIIKNITVGKIVATSENIQSPKIDIVVHIKPFS